MKKKSSSSAKKSLKSTKAKGAASGAKSGSTDIVKLILADHKPLKALIKVLKEPENSIDERKEAFEEFAPLLVAHAKPEEKTLYVFMKDEDQDLRVEGLEGDVEHSLADQLVKEIKEAHQEDLWTAKVKVLAELVEHHIEEEEEELLPDFKKKANATIRAKLGQQYSKLKPQFQAQALLKPNEEMERTAVGNH